MKLLRRRAAAADDARTAAIRGHVKKLRAATFRHPRAPHRITLRPKEVLIYALIEARSRFGLDDIAHLKVAAPLQENVPYVQSLTYGRWQTVESTRPVNATGKWTMFMVPKVMFFLTRRNSSEYVGNQTLYASPPVVASPDWEAAEDLFRRGANGSASDGDDWRYLAVQSGLDRARQRRAGAQASHYSTAFNDAVLLAFCHYTIEVAAQTAGLWKA